MTEVSPVSPALRVRTGQHKLAARPAQADRRWPSAAQAAPPLLGYQPADTRQQVSDKVLDYRLSEVSHVVAAQANISKHLNVNSNNTVEV